MVTVFTSQTNLHFLKPQPHHGTVNKNSIWQQLTSTAMRMMTAVVAATIT